MNASRRLIIETDIFSDVDDVGALAVAHHYVETGQAVLLAVGVNTPSEYGYRAVRVVNDYFGHDVPVGALFPLDSSVFDQDYAKFLWETYGTPSMSALPEDAVLVHRRALASAPDGSVTMVSLGFMHNLGRLLASGPDDISALPGIRLVEQKVDRLVVMGGRFPNGYEFNIVQFAENARTTIEAWPTVIHFLGWEVGAPVITGKTVSTCGPQNIVGAAYRQYNGAGTGRESWDLMTVQLAVEGAGDYYRLSEPGRVIIEKNGHTAFFADPGGSHYYAILVSSPEAVTTYIEGILTRAPAQGAFGELDDKAIAQL